MELSKEEMVLCAQLLLSDARAYEQIKVAQNNRVPAAFVDQLHFRRELSQRFIDEIAAIRSN